jgi:hypothetical protein
MKTPGFERTLLPGVPDLPPDAFSDNGAATPQWANIAARIRIVCPTLQL